MRLEERKNQSPYGNERDPDRLIKQFAEALGRDKDTVFVDNCRAILREKVKTCKTALHLTFGSVFSSIDSMESVVGDDLGVRSIFTPVVSLMTCSTASSTALSSL